MTRSSFRHPRTAVLGFYSTFATASRLISNYDLSQLGTLYPGGAGRISRLVRVISYYGQGDRCRAKAPVRGELEVSVRGRPITEVKDKCDMSFDITAERSVTRIGYRGIQLQNQGIDV